MTSHLKTDDLPFEIWHDVLRDVYEQDFASSGLDDPVFVLSPLHRRVLIHRNLSLVSKHLHELSSSVFMEDLHLHRTAALLGVDDELRKHPFLGRTVRRLSLHFFDYRCDVSVPPRERELKPLSETDFAQGSDYDGKAGAYRLSLYWDKRYMHANYAPSFTRQETHWVCWLGLSGSILSACTGLSEVTINAAGEYTYWELACRFRSYRRTPAILNLRDDALLKGLLACSNLRILNLIDPSPLEGFVSALSRWCGLVEINIRITGQYPEGRHMEEAHFSPPRFLASFTLDNRSEHLSSLPATVDLNHCSSLSTLYLGVLGVEGTSDLVAAHRLIVRYAHSLQDLTLSVKGYSSDVTALLSHGELTFPVLRTLTIHNGTCDVSLFSKLSIPLIEQICMHTIDVTISAGGAERTNKHWETFFEQPNFKHLKAFRAGVIDRSVKAAMRGVATAQGIDCRTRRTSDGDALEPEALADT